MKRRAIHAGFPVKMPLPFLAACWCAVAAATGWAQEDARRDIRRIDTRLEELRAIRQQEEAVINTLTRNKTVPVVMGSQDYIACRESSKRIKRAEEEEAALNENKKQLVLSEPWGRMQKIDARLEELRAVRDRATAVINGLTYNKTVPVVMGSRAYNACREASNRIKLAEEESADLNEERSHIVISDPADQVRKIKDRIEELRVIWRREIAVINTLTKNKTVPVVANSQEYHVSLESSKHINLAVGEWGRLNIIKCQLGNQIADHKADLIPATFTVDDIKAFADAGVKDDAIISEIKKSNSQFSEQDIANLQQAHIAAGIIEAIRDKTSGRPASG